MYAIKWTAHARKENADILKFWIDKNKSNVYSKKIRNETKIKLSLLKRNVLMGEQVEGYEEIRRILILRNFSIYYRVQSNIIEIVSFFDNRNDPEDLEI